MRKLFSFLLILFQLPVIVSSAQKDYTKLVNPFIGTGGHGHTYPGASMPFGMMQLSPDTREANWDGSSGYHYSDSVIYGFSHTHLSGTGIPDYCDILLMPFTGNVQWDPFHYRSAFSHQKEKASPGYYEVFLEKNQINARLTTSYRSGMHEYQFPMGTKEGKLLLDLFWRDEVLESSLEKISEDEIRGMRRSKSWAQNQVIYFHIKFDRPIKDIVLYNQDKHGTANEKKLVTGGKGKKAYVSFDLKGSTPLKLKIGISAVSMEGARKNLQQEIPHWNFETTRMEAVKSWNKELGKIEVKGGTPDQQTVFYTAMYHTCLAPNLFQDVDGQYRGTDGNVHIAKDFTNYTIFSLWDTYRAYHPLMTILNQRRTKDWISTFLHQYEEGGMLPVWELAGNETFCMIGYHSVPVIVDAYQKGIRDFDTRLALKAMRDYAESNRFGLEHYRKKGYIPNNEEHESVSKTLEYAYDDWCIAQYAKMLGEDSVYRNYIRRAQYYKNVFDPATRHMRGKVDAMWHKPFDAKEINNYFTEGNSWHYTFAVPQDIKSLIDLHGSKLIFASKLNELFTTTSRTTGRDQADVTGLIGQYAQGNEPSHHMAYLFNYVGQAWRTQELIHKINTEFYLNTADGLIGNEDCGQMSAWFIFSSMGFYPVCPGTGEYVIGTPLFDEVKIHLENGKQFVIKSKRQSPKSKYVESLSLNGKTRTQSYITHADLWKGGTLEFSLHDKTSMNWAAWEKDYPHSEITDELIEPVPFFIAESNKFRDSIKVEIGTVGKDSIYYTVETSKPKPYTAPIILKGDRRTVAAASVKNWVNQSFAFQTFYRLPTDMKIEVKSVVHPMYTAGGEDALIDGVHGSNNWRSGEWQSYYDQDFEAVIDLQKETPVNYIVSSVLQDVRSWIIYPKEVIYFISNDGKNYIEGCRVKTNPSEYSEDVQTKGMICTIDKSARYIKIIAINGGKLPEGHESAGKGSHLFISEIGIK